MNDQQPIQLLLDAHQASARWLRQTLLRALLAICIWGVAHFNVLANDDALHEWNGFRGGTKCGVADSVPCPKPQHVERYDWAVPVPGEGHSSPIIVDNRVIVTTAYACRFQERLRKWVAVATGAISMVAVVIVSWVAANGLICQTLDGSKWTLVLAAFAGLLVILVAVVMANQGSFLLDYGRCPIRIWLGTGITVTLCLAGAVHYLNASWPMRIIFGVLFAGVGIVLIQGLPAKDHAFGNGLASTSALVVCATAILPLLAATASLSSMLSVGSNGTSPGGKERSRQPAWRMVFSLFPSWFLLVALVPLAIRLGRADVPSDYGIRTEDPLWILVLGIGTWLVFLVWNVSLFPRRRTNLEKPSAIHGVLLAAVVSVSLLLCGFLACWLLRHAIAASGYLDYHLGRLADRLPAGALGAFGILVLVLLPVFGLIPRATRPSHLTIARKMLALGLITIAGMQSVLCSIEIRGDAWVRAIVCYDLRTGKQLWQCTGLEVSKKMLHRMNSAASPTPVVAGGRVVALFGPGLMCCDLSGRKLWENRDVRFRSVYGLAGSPVAWGRAVIVPFGSPNKPYVVGLDVSSSKELWRYDIAVERNVLSGNSRTPLIVEQAGFQGCLIWARDGVHCIDLKSGQPVWLFQSPWGNSGDLVASPVADAQSLFCAGPKAVFALDLHRLSDADEAILWASRTKGPNCASPVLCQGLLFTVSDSGIACCLDARDGKMYWRRRLKGKYYASLVAIAKHVWFCSQDGQVTIVGADRMFREITSFDLGEETLASFAVSGEQVVCRTSTRLICMHTHRILGSR